MALYSQVVSIINNNCYNRYRSSVQGGGR